MKKYFNVIVVFLLLITIVFFTKKAVMVMQQSGHEGKRIIVIDPGHGGIDPGKVGVNGALEKEINLKLALKLKVFLQKSGFKVVMTRTEDVGLYSESDSNKKRVDLKNRVELINNSGAVLAVSIHQNSFSQESSRGAQVFYHMKSQGGKALAETVQKQIKETMEDNNNRQAKSNESYYMLKQAKCPLIIVECGFLSNTEEAQLLCRESYQEKMAWAIHLAVTNYVNSNIRCPE